MSATPITPLDPRLEMFQRGYQQETFFNMKALAPRPLSEATEIYDTEFEDDVSDIEGSSPRLSINSTGRRSETTLSSFEELQTPNSNTFQGFNFDVSPQKPVEGPRGPHLFRSSTDSSFASQDENYYLTMSPLTPRVPSRPETTFKAPPVPAIPESTPYYPRPISTLSAAVDNLNKAEVAKWSPRQVARWMDDAGFEPAIVDKFEENDISGAILITLKFEDLRELDIQSFGQRHKLWNEIHNLRGSMPSTPAPPTPIEDRPSSPEKSGSRGRSQGCMDDEVDAKPRKRKGSSRRARRGPGYDDIISPLESVSIVGIEQLMPKPHKCSKGQNCSKWRRQQRLIDQFQKEHPVSPEGGTIWIAGDPGNPQTAEPTRPFSDAMPSVVASSDVLGPGTLPAFQPLEEASLQKLAARDPQDNVRQFLNFQHFRQPEREPEHQPQQPTTPPYEMFPPLPPQQNVGQPLQNLRTLPKLAIPSQLPPRAATAQAFSPYRMDRAEALSPELRNATHSPSGTIYRFNTPFSEMDLPVTAVPLGPIARDASQSVPPNMSYRHAPGPPIAFHNNSINRTADPNNPPQLSRAPSHTRRPSLGPSLPRLDENREIDTRLLPWSPISKPPQAKTLEDVAHAGWMKKRKTKLLRHEWHEHHFTLQGTRLAMHKDSAASEMLEYIYIDDYAVACSHLQSSKLNAAFKAMSISLGGGKDKDKDKDESAYVFQLIPAVAEQARKIRKRESLLPGGAEKANMKTHHFAVRSREERIEWMRELMLAKALKQKGEGFEVAVNGNMI